MSVFKLIDLRRGPELPGGTMLCRMLGVSKKSGYYAWRGRPPSRRAQQDALLTHKKIREIHSRSSRETYGYPRVHAQLRSLGISCGRRRVARLMKAAGLRGCTRRGRKRRTTRRDSQAAPAQDLLLRRNFVACQPNKVWLADITYVPTQEEEGFLYLAFILDTHSRRKDRRVVELGLLPHENRARGRCSGDGGMEAQTGREGLVMHHSDRGGVQYTAISFGKRLEEVGIVPSMGRTGTALDNALWRRASSPP